MLTKGVDHLANIRESLPGNHHFSPEMHTARTEFLHFNGECAPLLPIGELDNVAERLAADVDAEVLEADDDGHHDVGLAELLAEELARPGQDDLVDVVVLLLAHDVQVDEAALLPQLLQSAAHLKGKSNHKLIKRAWPRSHTAIALELEAKI